MAIGFKRKGEAKEGRRAIEIHVDMAGTESIEAWKGEGHARLLRLSALLRRALSIRTCMCRIRWGTCAVRVERHRRDKKDAERLTLYPCFLCDSPLCSCSYVGSHIVFARYNDVTETPPRPFPCLPLTPCPTCAFATSIPSFHHCTYCVACIHRHLETRSAG